MCLTQFIGHGGWASGTRPLKGDKHYCDNCKTTTETTKLFDVEGGPVAPEPQHSAEGLAQGWRNLLQKAVYAQIALQFVEHDIGSCGTKKELDEHRAACDKSWTNLEQELVTLFDQLEK